MESTAKFLDLQWSAVTESEDGKFFILDSWDHDDGLLRDGLDGSPIPADRLGDALHFVDPPCAAHVVVCTSWVVQRTQAVGFRLSR